VGVDGGSVIGVLHVRPFQEEALIAISSRSFTFGFHFSCEGYVAF